MNKYAGFFAAYNASIKKGNPTSKEDTILDYTEGRTASLGDLSPDELRGITVQLNALSGFVAGDRESSKSDKMRKSIIAIFRKMGKPTPEAITWAEKQGVKGEKKQFNEYSPGELFVLIRVAEKVLSDFQIALRKNIAKL